MKLLVTGKSGQLGWELARVLAELGEVIAVDRTCMDLGEPESIRAAVRDIKPDVILNAAAYTAVDRAEAEPDLAEAVNGVAPGILALEAKRLGALLVHYSTDYVFDGTKPDPYIETDIPHPLGVYGRTKLRGERAVQASGCEHLILRTSWVYSPRGKNFLLTIRGLARERPQLKVVDDQVGAPTSTRVIADATLRILRQRTGADPSELYHLTASGQTTWYGFARVIAELAAPPLVRVDPIRSSEYPVAAERPLNSRLSCEKILAKYHLALPHWETEARRVMAEILADESRG